MDIFKTKYNIVKKQIISEEENNAIRTILSNKALQSFFASDSKINRFYEPEILEGVRILTPTYINMMKEIEENGYMEMTLDRLIVLNRILSKIDYDLGNPAKCYKNCIYISHNHCNLFNTDLSTLDRYELRTNECVLLVGKGNLRINEIVDFEI